MPTCINLKKCLNAIPEQSIWRTFCLNVRALLSLPCRRSPDFREQRLSCCDFECNCHDEAEHCQSAIPGFPINPGLHTEGLFHCTFAFSLLVGHGVYVTSFIFANLFVWGCYKKHMGMIRMAATSCCKGSGVFGCCCLGGHSLSGGYLWCS